MATQKINQINYAGITYQFVDEDAQEGLSTVSNQVSNVSSTLTTKLNEEVARAKAAEQGITGSVVMKEAGKGLSSNDYTDTDKAKVQGLKIMTGATATADGESGQVPAPTKGNQDKYLKADGTWGVPTDTTYADATHTAHGLMTASDKTKMDLLEPSTDITTSTTTFNGNVISELYGNGKSVTTTFNSDGTITEKVITSGGTTMNFKTTFNADGSITREVIA